MAAIILYLFALGFRVLDIFVLRLDERWGEILLSKSLGFLLVLLFLRFSHQRLADVGLHARRLGSAIAIAVAGVGALFLLGYGVEFVSLQMAGLDPELVFAAIDPKTGMAGGLGFAAWLVLGNLVNSSMEEGLFRGVMLRTFMQRFSFVRANLWQAALFAAWHLVWPVKHLWAGTADVGGALAEATMLTVATFVSGYVYGYFYRQTNSLWTPWVAHTLHNSALNLIHIETAEGLDANLFLLQVIVVAGLIPLMGFVRWAAKRTAP